MYQEKSDEELEKLRKDYEKNPNDPKFACWDSSRLGVTVFAALLLFGSASGVNVIYLFLRSLLEKLPSDSPLLAAFILGAGCVAMGRFMFFIKEEFLFVYAWMEIGFAFGAGGIAWQQYYSGVQEAVTVSIFGAIYIGVRGFENRNNARLRTQNSKKV